MGGRRAMPDVWEGVAGLAPGTLRARHRLQALRAQDRPRRRALPDLRGARHGHAAPALRARHAAPVRVAAAQLRSEEDRCFVAPLDAATPRSENAHLACAAGQLTKERWHSIVFVSRGNAFEQYAPQSHLCRQHSCRQLLCPARFLVVSFFLTFTFFRQHPGPSCPSLSMGMPRFHTVCHTWRCS